MKLTKIGNVRTDYYALHNLVLAFAKKTNWPLDELETLPREGVGSLIWLLNIHGWGVFLTVDGDRMEEIEARINRWLE